ncbi:MAG TPA: hypothetical protein VGC26_09320, partial [Afipia sp.]
KPDDGADVTSTAWQAATGQTIEQTKVAIDSIVSDVAVNTSDLVSLESLQDIVAQSALEQLVRTDALHQLVNDRTIFGDQPIATVITQTQQQIVDGDSALAYQIDTIGAKVDTNAAAIVSERDARADADSALAIEIDTLTSRTSANEAGITSEAQTRADAVEAIATRLDTLDASTGAISASLTNEQQARADADSALTTSLTTLGSAVNDPATGLVKTRADLTSEEQTRADEDSALSTRIDTVTATAGANTAAITIEEQARASADSAISTSLSTLAATVSDPVTGLAKTRADLSAEQQTRADADSAMASQISTLSANTASTAADLVTEQQTRATADSSLSTSLTTLSSTVNDPGTGLAKTRSDLQSESSTRASADSAQASQIGTLQSTAGILTSSVSTLSSATSDLANRVNTAVFQISAVSGTSRAAIKILADGYSGSEIDLVAGTINVWSQDGAEAIEALSVDSSGLVTIPNLAVGQINTQHIANNSVTDATNVINFGGTSGSLDSGPLLGSFTITTAANEAVLVLVGGRGSVTGSPGASGGTVSSVSASVTLQRNGAAIQSQNFVHNSGASGNGNMVLIDSDIPGAGTWTYSLYISGFATDSTGDATAAYSINNGTMVAIILKR